MSFTLRGVGFFNSDLATPPAVTVHLDEAPLPYPAMTKLIAFELQPVENVHSTLDQDSQSWRVGLNWTVRTGLLLYANVSKGYKAGAVPVLAASTVAQLTPVPQESLLCI
jgi:outer membrane receptor protein involved in Fe transport